MPSGEGIMTHAKRGRAAAEPTRKAAGDCRCRRRLASPRFQDMIALRGIAATAGELDGGFEVRGAAQPAGRGGAAGGRERDRARAGRRHRCHRADGNRPDRAAAPGRYQENRRAASDRHRERRIPPRRRGSRHGDRRACSVRQGLAGRGRRGEADRLDPDQGPRHRGRQSVQRLAGRRQRARLGGGRGGRQDRGTQGHARAAGRGHSGRARQDLARPGRDRGLAVPAAAARACERCLSALHPAHRDGHRGGRGRHQPHPRRPRHLHRGAGRRSARWRRPCCWWARPRRRSSARRSTRLRSTGWRGR